MTDAHNTPSSRIDTEPTPIEASPSTGWQETYTLLDVDLPGDPVDAGGCGAAGCHETEGLRRVDHDGRRRVLCPGHALDFIETAPDEVIS